MVETNEQMEESLIVELYCAEKSDNVPCSKHGAEADKFARVVKVSSPDSGKYFTNIIIGL